METIITIGIASMVVLSIGMVLTVICYKGLVNLMAYLLRSRRAGNW